MAGANDLPTLAAKVLPCPMNPTHLPSLDTGDDEKRRIRGWSERHLQMQDGEERRAENLASETERIHQAVSRMMELKPPAAPRQPPPQDPEPT